MRKRDPNKTARNKYIAKLKEEKRKLLDEVVRELSKVDEYSRYSSEKKLNAFIGSKTGEYLALNDEVILSPVEYRQKWLKGLKDKCIISRTTNSNPRHIKLHNLLKGDFPWFKKYLLIFLDMSYLAHYEEHYKKKPKISESEYWFGSNNDSFGLLVTPRFRHGCWENDKSEIRKFKYPYWTLSHVMETGLCYMNEDKIRTFSSIDEYLRFFRDMLRRTASKYQLDIADRYIDYVKTNSKPDEVPVLIPELRFDPLKAKHKYRLDFLIVNPWSMSKFGFEISPSSSHTKLTGAKKKLKELNQQAQDIFEAEMRKHKSYWRKYGITYITYTDQDLSEMDTVWEDVRENLECNVKPLQLDILLLSNEVNV